MTEEQTQWETKILLSLCLQKEGIELALSMDDVVCEDAVKAFNEYLQRRRNWEPLQYITEETEFMGRIIKTSPGVLIARQDTEVLVNEALARLPIETNCHVLDLGTGSGNIILSLALERPKLQGIAIDISAQALELAEKNFNLLGLKERITLIKGNWFDPLKNQKFDMIVSNPPYISHADMNTLPKSVMAEPSLALYGGSDGLGAYREIIRRASEFLNPGGWLLMEIGADQGEKVCKLMTESGIKTPKIIQDTGKRDRVIAGKNN